MRAITHYEPLEDDQPGTPCEIYTYPVTEDLGQEVIRYLREITEEASLNAGLTIRGDEAVVS
jgi:hypothetical protein